MGEITNVQSRADLFMREEGVKMLHETITQILEQVDRRKEELIDQVGDLIRFQTPSPPARNTKEAQHYIASKLNSLGFEVDMWDVFPDDPNVVGTLKGTHSGKANSLIINGHMDVAEVGEDLTQWKHDFYSCCRRRAVIRERDSRYERRNGRSSFCRTASS